MYEPTDAEELEDPYWGYPMRKTMEEERVKEEIAKWLHSHTVKVRQESRPWLEKTPWEDLPKDTRLDTQKSWRDIASQILAIKGIRIEADDQGLPLAGPFSLREAENVRSARQGMLKAGFVKCLPKKI